ncbi:MAG: hypothetical protein DCF30_23470 [Hyphomicrobiales bacterium]|nr:MAG: hypothetical protein DCF30_23470 [Hyphomicrobiales bacterium]
MAGTDHAMIEIDRISGRVSAHRVRDYAAIAMLNAYGAVSKRFMQRGLYKACRLVGSSIWTGRTAVIRLGPDANVTFPAHDPYWNRMLLQSYDHEPEMAWFLKSLAGINYGFVDCGANIGYCSVFVASGSCGGAKPVLAIEASAPTFAVLEANSAAHASKITTFHRAILDRSGVEVRLNEAVHEARGISVEPNDRAGEVVLSITVDDLVEGRGWTDMPLVVKLDVEGVEREALVGMERTLANDALVIYEDHGSDATHALTQHMLQDRQLDVHLLLDHGSLQITNCLELDRHKLDRTKGYNLVAVRPNSHWLAVLPT